MRGRPEQPVYHFGMSTSGVNRSWWVGLAGAVIVTVALACGGNPGGENQQVADLNEPPPASGWTVEVTYLANAGVMLRSGDTKVLIDGLFRPYEGYPVLPESYREQLERAQPPFDGIDLILVSHQHGDHFQAESVARYLQSQPDAMLVVSDQLGDAVAAVVGDSSLNTQIAPLTLGLGAEQVVMMDDVAVSVMSVGHGTGAHREVANFAHAVKLGDLVFLHVGDADFSQGLLEQIQLPNIDVAFLPPWFLNEGADFVRTHIQPKHIVAVHMPPGPHRGGQGVGAFPDAVPFVRMLQRRYY